MSDNKQASGTPETDASHEAQRDEQGHKRPSCESDWHKLNASLETRLLAAQSELAESRRANAMLREAVGHYFIAVDEGLRGGDVVTTRKNLDAAFYATADDHKAWEDALWGEPVAWCIAYDDPNMNIRIHSDSTMCKPNAEANAKRVNLALVELYAKPKGLK